ncbi:hypothetical protein BOTBODRAFT_180114 [Botryobasidium botryosum FD-172 SS1]|uniref:Uncharacterized protein n=1 Tax=Botryobasidium botryosum (strain FD-172 SS1) TaxID=930990 RepID=A0A067M088_BOTB1|nr:hypothetical protein BOTBODRAFT_180114 [Botryobasidium botryosum FD-172 SS1]
MLQRDHSKNKGGPLGGISPKQPLVFSPIAIIALPLTLTLTDLLALSSDSSSNTAPIIRVISADPIADDLVFHFTIQLQSSPFIHHIFLSAMAQNNQVIDLPAEFYQQINTASLEELINLVFHQDAHSSWRNISDLINVVEFFNCIADHQDYRTVTIEPTDIPFNEHHWFQLHPWAAPVERSSFTFQFTFSIYSGFTTGIDSDHSVTRLALIYIWLCSNAADSSWFHFSGDIHYWQLDKRNLFDNFVNSHLSSYCDEDLTDSEPCDDQACELLGHDWLLVDAPDLETANYYSNQFDNLSPDHLTLILPLTLGNSASRSSFKFLLTQKTIPGSYPDTDVNDLGPFHTGRANCPIYYVDPTALHDSGLLFFQIYCFLFHPLLFFILDSVYSYIHYPDPIIPGLTTFDLQQQLPFANLEFLRYRSPVLEHIFFTYQFHQTVQQYVAFINNVDISKINCINKSTGTADTLKNTFTSLIIKPSIRQSASENFAWKFVKENSVLYLFHFFLLLKTLSAFILDQKLTLDQSPIASTIVSFPLHLSRHSKTGSPPKPSFTKSST